MENDVILYCEMCKFYEDKFPDKIYMSDRNGLCRRYPRYPLSKPNGNVVMVMCETNKQDWCGEFIQK